jgi:UDP-glucose 4-epimerase
MATRSKGTIVVTGISGNLGRTIGAHLVDDGYSVIGIDKRPYRGSSKGVKFHQLDVRRRETENIFRTNKVKALVHMGIVYGSRLAPEEQYDFNVMGTKQVLDYCVAHGVKKVVVLSSAAVYGPRPENSSFLGEDAPLLAAAAHRSLRDLVEVDMHAQSFFWAKPEIETVILRPSHVVGPTVRNVSSSYLRLRRPWQMMGFDPIVQLVHQEDVARAIDKALVKGARGIYNVTGPGEAPLSAVLKVLGKNPLQVPHPIGRSLLRRLWKFGLARYSAAELEHLLFPCVVDGQRAHDELGYRPKYSLRETILSVMTDVGSISDSAA